MEVLNPVHKKIIGSLTAMLPEFEARDGREHPKYVNAFHAMFAEWMGKLDGVNNLCPYADAKIRNIFFNFLKDVNFSYCGLQLYLRLFEPCLKCIFNLDGYQCLVNAFALPK